MSTAKEQFISDSDLSKWWGPIANDSRFDKVLLYAGNVALESLASDQQREGVLFFKQVLLTLAQQGESIPTFPKTGLRHDLDTPKRTLKPTEKPKK